MQVVQDGKLIAEKTLPPPIPKPDPGTPPKEFANRIGMKFVWIPPGSFMMGSPQEEIQRQVEQGEDETQHKVTLTKGFYMGVYTVTQEEWQAVIGKNPSHFKGEKNLPVHVSWRDCQRFIKKLREKDKKAYRLPTEAEWEYACRAGTTTPFHFGETISTDQANYDGVFIYGDGKKGVARGKTVPVGSFPANAFGLYDMHGNVWQWCQDWVGHYPQNDVVDPQGPEKGTHHVLRGGAYNRSPAVCRSATRAYAEPGEPWYGFRLCFSLEEDGALPPENDPDRKAAVYVLSIGGTVRVDDEVDDRKTAAELPQKPFRLTYVDLLGNRKVSNADLAIFKGCRNLTNVNLSGTNVKNEGLANFKDCKKLTHLSCEGTLVSDLSSLIGMLLTFLNIKGTAVDDLSPLEGMKLEHLDCTNTRVGNLSPLRKMNLKFLSCAGTPVSDLTAVKDMKLTTLICDNSRVTNLSPLKDMKLTRLICGHTKVSDLTPLKGMPLREVQLQQTQVGDAGVEHLASLKNLAELNLNGTAVTAKGVAKLRAALPGCNIGPPTLETTDPDRRAAEYVLSIGGVVRVNDEVDDTRVVADLPKKPFRLTYVNLSGKGDKVRNAALAAFQGCKHLKVLRLDGTLVKEEGLAYFKDCKDLEVLDLSHTHLTDAGLAHFKDCKKLREIGFNFAKITNVGLAYLSGCKDLKDLGLFGLTCDDPLDAGLACILKDSLKLETLNLGATRVIDAPLAHLQNNKSLKGLALSGLNTDKAMVYLKGCTNLTGLTLEGAQVTDKGMVYLKDCTNLTSLNLSHTAVGDEGLANFKNCKKLRELALHNTKLSDKGLAYFYGCENLERLSQRGSNVTKAGLDAFRKALPKCGLDVAPEKELPPNPKKAAEGFVSLFNGKDLTGWKTHPKQPGNWRVNEEGILVGSGPTGVSHLYTVRGDYTNFELRLEARVNKGGFSGVYVRTPFGPAYPANNPNWLVGYNIKMDKDRLGGLIVADAKNEKVERDLIPEDLLGKWLTLEVTALDNRVTVKLGGKTTIDHIDKKRQFTKGHIALQQHSGGTVAEFRKIEIKELPPAKAGKAEDGFGVGTKLVGSNDLSGTVNGKRVSALSQDVEVEVKTRSGNMFTAEFWQDGRSLGWELTGSISDNKVEFTVRKALAPDNGSVAGQHVFVGRFENGELTGEVKSNTDRTYWGKIKLKAK